MWRALVLALLVPQLAFAAEVCVDIDVSTWTQEQRNARQAIAHALAFNPGGQNLIPHSPSGAQVTEAGNTQICFTDPTFDVPTVITAQAMLDRYAVEEAARQAAATVAANRQAAFESEISGNDFCTGELADLTTRIQTVRDTLNTAIQGASNVSQVKAAMTNLNDAYATGFRKLLRCIRSREYFHPARDQDR